MHFYVEKLNKHSEILHAFAFIAVGAYMFCCSSPDLLQQKGAKDNRNTIICFVLYCVYAQLARYKPSPVWNSFVLKPCKDERPKILYKFQHDHENNPYTV